MGKAAYLRCVLFTVTAVLLVSGPARTEDNPEEIGKLARASARLTAEYLKQTIDEETGLWVSPFIRKRLKRRPTGKFTIVPVYTHTVTGYRDVWKWVKAPTADDPYRKIYKKTQEPIRVGTKTGETRKRAIMETIPEVSHETHYFSRWIEGLNALGAYALLCAGEHPQSAVLDRSLEWLEKMATLGLPDTTYELSLMMMVFLRADPDRYEDLIDRGITKLLSGQITKEPGRGQWGYYSVNWSMLKVINQQIAKLDKYKKIVGEGIKADKDFLNMSPRQKAAYYKQIELDGAVSWLNRRLKEISREFSLGRFWWEGRKEILEGEAIKKYYCWPNTLYDARELRLGDVLNTEIALMALAEASNNGWFKKEKQKELEKGRVLVLRRLRGKLKAPSPPDIKVVVARAAAALKKSQKSDGRWDLCRTQLKTINPFEEMRKNKREPTPPKNHEAIKRHEIEPVDVTFVGTASATHSFSLIADIVGTDAIRRKYSLVIDKGKAAYEEILKDYLGNPDAIPTHQHAFLPYRYWFTIPSVKDNLGLESLREEDNSNALLKRIIQKQNPDGIFGRALDKRFRNRYMPPPTFPEEVQDLWVEKKVIHGRYFYPKTDPRFVNSALTLIFYSRYLKSDVTGPKEWPDVHEYFTNARQKLPSEVAVPEPEKKPLEVAVPEPEKKLSELVVPASEKKPLKKDETL